MTDQPSAPDPRLNFDAAGDVNIGRDVVGRDQITVHNVQGVDPKVVREFEDRFNEFLALYLQLHRRLQEWKDLHNLLQDLQIQFATCRGYALELGAREPSGALDFLTRPANQKQKIEKYMYEFSVNWGTSKRTHDKLGRAVRDLHHIRDDFPAGDPGRPDGLAARLDEMRTHIDQALHEEKRFELAEAIGEFAHQIDDGLYVADKALMGVAKQINDLPGQVRVKVVP